MKKNIVFLLLLTVNWATDKVFVACEGNYNEGNGSLWTIIEENIYEYQENPIGDVVQSLLIYDNMLFVIVNGSSNIQVYNINESGLSFFKQIETNESGPREMAIYDSPIQGGCRNLYFTNWYSADVKKINLNTWEIEEEIPTPGLPEDILIHNGLLYVSITMNHDWTDASQVITIDPSTNTIVESFEVGFGPGSLLMHEDEVYVSRTYYDNNWDAYYGTSKINSNGTVTTANYGSGTACGGGIYTFQNEVYRLYNGGIAQLNDELEIMPETRLGDYNAGEVYSAEVIGEYIFFGLSDYSAPDEVTIVDAEGNEVDRYEVGALPGDFAIWKSCTANGDINFDSTINILDIVQIVNNILINAEFDCNADLNGDNQINILDVIIIVDLIIG